MKEPTTERPTCVELVTRLTYRDTCCGKPAKFLTPRRRPVCGNHRRMLDRMFRCAMSPNRCVPLGAAGKETL